MIARIDVSNPKVHSTNNGYILSFELKNPAKARQMVFDVRDKKINNLIIEVDKQRDKRSLRSNSFMWELCSRISEVMRIDKNEIYRMAIRHTTNYYPFPIDKDAIDDFVKIWKGHGEGWFVDVIDDYPEKEGFKLVFAYYGTSQYDSFQMSELIDYILEDAENLGIDVLSEMERIMLEKEMSIGEK